MPKPDSKWMSKSACYIFMGGQMWPELLVHMATKSPYRQQIMIAGTAMTYAMNCRYLPEKSLSLARRNKKIRDVCSNILIVDTSLHIHTESVKETFQLNLEFMH